VERSVYIVSVVNIDVSCMVIIESVMVVINIHTTHSENPIVPITYINITNLGHTTIVVIINRYVLYLDNGTIIIVLGIRTIIITGIHGYSIITSGYIILNIKIEFTIGKY
jgi:hypothetical protein